MKSKVHAFTLAETLITLVIIGVIAAITVPAVMNNINTKQKEEKLKNVYHKLSHSADKMLGISGMNGYASTEEFLKAFGHHMSLSKVCKASDISSCWGTKKVKLDDNTEYAIANATTPAALGITGAGYKDVMAFVTNDGTSYLVSYNTQCDISLSDGKTWSKEGLSTSTSYISGVFDYNGGTKPNKLDEDIINFNDSTGLGSVTVPDDDDDDDTSGSGTSGSGTSGSGTDDDNDTSGSGTGGSGGSSTPTPTPEPKGYPG